MWKNPIYIKNYVSQEIQIEHFFLMISTIYVNSNKIYFPFRSRIFISFLLVCFYTNIYYYLFPLLLHFIACN